MIEENSGPAKSVPLSEVFHFVSVPLSEVLLYLFSVGGSDNTKNKIPINNFQEMCTFVASRHGTL